MKTAVLFTVAIFSTTLAARADFSYTTTSRPTGGSMAAMMGGNPTTTKMLFKGQKMKTESGDTATIIDLEAQTVTTVNNRAKTVSVTKLSDLGPKGNDIAVKVDVKETGQQKNVNGYNAKELLMTMDVDMPQLQQMGMGKLQMEVQLWLSADVPGAGEIRDFYKKNMDRFPWAALAGGNPQLQQAMAQLQKKVAEMNGVQVETVIKLKPGSGAAAPQSPQMPQMTPAQQAQMQAAMDRLKQLQQQGGPAAEAAAQAMARMGNMGRAGASPAGASSSMMEITADSSAFSTASIADSEFAVPAGYQRLDSK